MREGELLSMMRPLMLHVDSFGVIKSAHGGFGGFYGHVVDELAGSSVFDFVPPDAVDELATYFIESAGETLRTVSLPLPFRVPMLAADGTLHAADVIASGMQTGSDVWDWAVVIMPVALSACVSRSLDAEMAGASRQAVREMLTEELVVDNDSYCTRWFLVDLADPAMPTVTTGRDEAQPMADALVRATSAHGWRPWDGVAPGDTSSLRVEDMPAVVRRCAAVMDWRRSSVAPVHLDGEVIAAYLLFGSVPEGYPLGVVKSNVRARISGLVDVTALLMGRWRERDRLVTAATRDSLTGLANRDAFSDALSSVDEPSSLLYIDVDRFKTVNDRFGHNVGDRVLTEVADRIVAACRPNDVVARFGGDEFVVLLRGADQAAAQMIGERIVATVGAPMPLAGGSESVNVSVGLASLAGDDDDDVISAADRAMMQAKRGGRARLVSVGAPTGSVPADSRH